MAREHVVIHDQCIAPAEQLRKTDLLRRSVFTHAIEDVVMRDLATVRQRTPPGSHSFHLAAQGHFGLQQPVARGAVLGGFVWEAHLAPLMN